MGRKILLAVACCLALSESLAKDQVAVIKLEDSISEATLSRLYRNIPVGVYASAAPYAAYSFHVPKFLPAKNSEVVPVKEESVIIENTNGFLKDSYGNKFVNQPQALAYRTTFPQQFVQLQDLPAHLSQPLVSAAPTLQYKQVTPHFFGPGHINLHSFQGISAPAAHRYGHVYQPQLFSGSVRSFAPGSTTHHQVNPITQQQQHPSTNQAVFANTRASEQYLNLKDVGKFQRLEEKHPNFYVKNGNIGLAPQITQNDKAQLKAAASTPTANKGKKAVINLVTKPPVPLLDLNLLEPLTFANPLVPQVQHFLPRINAATYHRLPQLDLNEVKKEMKQFVIQNTKSYDSSVVKGKPKINHQGKEEKVSPPQNEDTHELDLQAPTVTSKGVPNEGPEFSYEINSPNYKETYKEQVVSYNKETQSEPVHYDYNENTEKEPVTYSYVHKEPVQVKNVHYESNGQNEKHLVFNFEPVKHKENEGRHHPPQQQKESEESPNDESSEGERQPYKQQHQGQSYDEEAPVHIHHQVPHHREEEAAVHAPHHRPEHREEEAPVHVHHHRPEHREDEAPIHTHHHRPEHRQQEAPVLTHYHRPEHKEEEEPVHVRHNRPEHSEDEAPVSPHHQRPNHRQEEYHHKSNKHGYQNINSHPPIEYSQVKISPVQKPETHFQPIITEYEEDIRLLPAPKEYATIKVDPNQHIGHHGQVSLSHNTPQPHNRPQDSSHHQTPSHQRVHHYPEQHFHEKSKRVITKEELPEGGNHNNEQRNADKDEQEERNEEDFEKGYKNAAYGFPAYESNSRDHEKEIYNPETYGHARYHTDFDIEHSPFQQYQDEGDEFPKSTRTNYKDAIDKTKEEYFLDYAISKPKSIENRYRHKEDYYKMFMKRKPQHAGDERESDKKNKQSAKYSAAPAFEYHSEPKPKQTFAKYRVAPQILEFDYSKSAPKDSSAHATRPHNRFKTHTQFVEPQFQYGFEPSALPRLLDSELAAMASNHSPNSEKPSTRKKIYKENWYIKKTSTNGGKAAS